MRGYGARFRYTLHFQQAVVDFHPQQEKMAIDDIECLFETEAKALFVSTMRPGRGRHWPVQQGQYPGRG
jgi:hypothetical protein